MAKRVVKVRSKGIDLNKDYGLGPMMKDGKYQWDIILDGKLRFYICGVQISDDCQLRNFPSLCRQRANQRGRGVETVKFKGKKVDLKYGKNGVLVQGNSHPERHTKRVNQGGIGNNGGTPRRRSGFQTPKPMDPNKATGQFLDGG